VKKSENKKSGQNKQVENQKREKRTQKIKLDTVRTPDFFYKSRSE
jgi:hypothetical protein